MDLSEVLNTYYNAKAYLTYRRNTKTAGMIGYHTETSSSTSISSTYGSMELYEQESAINMCYSKEVDGLETTVLLEVCEIERGLPSLIQTRVIIHA